MSSQLLLRIDKALAVELDPIRRGVFLAQKAIYLCRSGDFVSAHQITTELRKEFGDGHSGVAMAWLMLAEGLLARFEKLGDNSLDRIARSQVLAVALQDKVLAAVASAWKAHIEFELSRFDSMFQSLASCLRYATKDNHAALSRFAMVLCNLNLTCGQRDDAQRAFRLSRDHSLADGDQAGVEALLYNKAAFSIARARAVRSIYGPEACELGFLRREVESARNLQTLAGIRALTHLVDYCDARLLVLEGRFEDAIECLERVRKCSPFGAFDFDQSYIDLEVSYCNFRIGRFQASVELFSRVKVSMVEGLDDDEQVVAYSMLVELARSGSSYGPKEVFEEKSLQARDRYLCNCDALKRRLTSDLAEFWGSV